jgi:hypothetical protein
MSSTSRNGRDARKNLASASARVERPPQWRRRLGKPHECRSAGSVCRNPAAAVIARRPKPAKQSRWNGMQAPASLRSARNHTAYSGGVRVGGAGLGCGQKVFGRFVIDKRAHAPKSG